MLNPDFQGYSKEEASIFKGKCPKCDCGIRIYNTGEFIIDWDRKPHEEMMYVFKCPICDELIIQIWNIRSEDRLTLRNMYPNRKSITEFSDEIMAISPEFIEIYNEAEIAENNNLLNICGPGYRKALEFLIKDYIIKENPDKKDEVKKEFLGPCISKYIEDEMLKDIAERAVWLGNDETHYIRTWKDKDLSDMKGFIKQVIYSIENELQYRKMKEEMPKRKKIERT